MPNDPSEAYEKVQTVKIVYVCNLYGQYTCMIYLVFTLTQAGNMTYLIALRVSGFRVSFSFISLSLITDCTRKCTGLVSWGWWQRVQIIVWWRCYKSILLHHLQKIFWRAVAFLEDGRTSDCKCKGTECATHEWNLHDAIFCFVLTNKFFITFYVMNLSSQFILAPWTLRRTIVLLTKPDGFKII